MRLTHLTAAVFGTKKDDSLFPCVYSTFGKIYSAVLSTSLQTQPSMRWLVLLRQTWCDPQCSPLASTDSCANSQKVPIVLPIC